MENTSGQGKLASVPPEIDKWNWGAFLLSWIWGIGNETFIAFLCFVPFVGFVMPFVLGAKGSAWAWQNKRWDSIEHFQSVQKKWAKWALIVFAGLIVFFAILIFTVMASLKNSEAYKLGVNKLQTNAKALAALGEPISTGMPSGNFESSGNNGSADLSFSVEGSKKKGTVYLEATKNLGKWTVQQAELELDDSEERIDLN